MCPCLPRLFYASKIVLSRARLSVCVPIPCVPAQHPPQSPPLVIAPLSPSLAPISLPCSKRSDLPVGHTPPQRGPWNSTRALRSEGHRALDVTLFLSRSHTSAGAVSFFLAASSCCGFRWSLDGLRPPAFLPRTHVLQPGFRSFVWAWCL